MEAGIYLNKYDIYIPTEYFSFRGIQVILDVNSF